MLFFHYYRDDCRVDRAAARTHHNALKGSDAHGCVKALAVYYCRNRRTVAEVAGNYFAVLGVAEHFNGLFAYKAVRCAVKTVAANTVFFVVFIRQSIHVCIVGHCLMKSRIKNGNLRNPFHNLLASLDSCKVCGVVERPELKALFNSIFNIVRHKHRTAEFFRTVQNAVTDSVDFVHRRDNAVLGVCECFDNNLNGCCMVRHFIGQSLYVFALVRRHLVSECAFGTDLFAVTFCENALIIHINKLIFKR